MVEHISVSLLEKLALRLEVSAIYRKYLSSIYYLQKISIDHLKDLQSMESIYREYLLEHSK